MRLKRVEADPVFAEFRRVWELTGDKYMTRAQIAEYFNRSQYWVQWMFVKTNCIPRTRSPKVKAREEGAPDGRLDYINEMQTKSALVAIMSKLLIRAKEMPCFSSSHPQFSRRFSNLRRIVLTAEKRIKAVHKLDPNWHRLPQMERAIIFGHKALEDASKLVRK